MRFFACILLLPLLFCGPAPQSAATFPIPDMQEAWPGAKLTDADKLLLRKAVESDLRKLEEEIQSGDRLKLGSVDSADLDLGSLGKGVIVTLSDSVLCGTGGCPIYAYIREKNAYRNVLGGYKGIGPNGWAFAVVKSKTKIPDLVIARNNGGGQMGLILFRYSGDAFAPQACEILTAKNPTSTLSTWWDASQVNVEPCAIGATLNGPELVSATEATTWIEFASR